jgi:hypothetical protein
MGREYVARIRLRLVNGSGCDLGSFDGKPGETAAIVVRAWLANGLILEPGDSLIVESFEP